MKFPLLASCLCLTLLTACAGDKPAAPATGASAAAARPAEPAAPPPPVESLDLTPGDVAKIQETLRALTGKPVNETATWYNPDTQVQGLIRILRDGYDAQNHPCREFASTVIRDPLFRQQTGFVCRQADGAWVVVAATDYPLSKRQP